MATPCRCVCLLSMATAGSCTSCSLSVGLAGKAHQQDPCSSIVVVLSNARLQVGGEVVRLSGIDAPEKDQTCKGANGRLYLCGGSHFSLLC